MHIPKRALFFDFHTLPTNPDVGRDFDMDRMADGFAESGVDFVTFPVRCNLGMAYYPTKRGIPHPALRRDLFGDLARACRARNIALSAYINVGLSHEEAYRRRDWTVLRADGRMYDREFNSHTCRQMCYYSGYGDHVAGMAKEVAETYDVAGFFFDCFHTHPCIGVECMEKMKAEGVDWSDPLERSEFNYRKMLDMGHRLSACVRAVKPDLLIYFNGLDFSAQAELGSYLELECLPQGNWGYELLPLVARYMRTLGKPMLNMTGRFQKSWGDFGGIRTDASVEYDCIQGIALGVPPNIGDHFHPRGDVNRPATQLVKTVYDRLRPLDPWVDGAVPLVDMANVMTWDYPGYRARGSERETLCAQARQSQKAATRMLSELKIQFDNCGPSADWSAYRVLILPDDVTVTPELADRLKAYLDNGGHIIASYQAGLDPEKTRFMLEQEWGVTYRGDDPLDPAYLEVEPELAAGMPDMPVTLYDRGAEVVARPGARTLATLTAPYYNREWDGRHGFLYTPPDRTTGRPAVTLRDRVAYISHPVFRTYFTSGALPLRTLVAGLLDRFLPDPLIRAPGAPSFSRVSVTTQPNRRMVYVMAYLPESRGAGVNMIEEPLTLNDFEVRLRLDGRRPRSAYLAPGREALDLRIEEGYAIVRIPHVVGWAVAVFEEEP